MSIDLCEHDLPIRACEICREAADLLGKGDNVLISRAYLTEWIREANKYQAAINKLEVMAKENAALRKEIRELNQITAAAQKAALDASEYICACGIRVTPHKCIADNGF